ncbi:proteasome inhibitor PI31 subunit-like [Halichondria panicea]|uniref:proteasome inhibitor PI31 subunit-like n=1 Tax=Halichondria panicea TaxID=6063 RepID=UPI00312B8A1E
MADSTLDSLLEATLAHSKVSSPQDALITAVHSTLLAADYSLLAVGDQDFAEGCSTTAFSVSSNSNPSLPDGWNSSQDVYTLQYRHETSKKLCLVKAILMDGQLLISATVTRNTSEVYTVALEMAKYVKDDTAFTTPSVFQNLLQLMSILSKEIEGKLSQTCSRQVSLSSGPPSAVPDRATRPHGEREDPLRIGPPRRPDRAADRDLNPLGPGPFRYGDTDRFPFISGGPSGGGMIFDPLRQEGGMGGGFGGGFGPSGPFPPSHPHGARYDPVFPVGPRPRPPGRGPGRGYGEPDPDHLPLPGGYDDMFS